MCYQDSKKWYDWAGYGCSARGQRTGEDGQRRYRRLPAGPGLHARDGSARGARLQTGEGVAATGSLPAGQRVRLRWRPSQACDPAKSHCSVCQPFPEAWDRQGGLLRRSAAGAVSHIANSGARAAAADKLVGQSGVVSLWAEPFFWRARLCFLVNRCQRCHHKRMAFLPGHGHPSHATQNYADQESPPLQGRGVRQGHSRRLCFSITNTTTAKMLC